MTTFFFDCTALGVNSDPALECGLYLPAVSSSLTWRISHVLQQLPFLHLCT